MAKYKKRKKSKSRYYSLVHDYERTLISYYLEKLGTIDKAAAYFDLNRTTLSMRMKALGISKQFHSWARGKSESIL